MSNADTAREPHCNIDGGDPADTAPSARRFTVDMRRFEPRERLPLLEMSLDALEPGETLEVIFEYWPETLTRYLERTCAEDFEWWQRGRGEEWCGLAIRRRPHTDRSYAHG